MVPQRQRRVERMLAKRREALLDGAPIRVAGVESRGEPVEALAQVDEQHLILSIGSHELDPSPALSTIAFEEILAARERITEVTYGDRHVAFTV